MRHLFIVNPAAGKKNSTALLEEKLSRLSFDHEVVYTQCAGDAQRITEQAAAAGEPVRIYACGGDGTLNEVVNGAAGHDHVAITNVPKGTGNDFLKVFGPQAHTQFSDLEALAVGPQAAFDLMDCNGKLGIDVVCCGADARVGSDVHRYKRFSSGILAYILALIENVLFKGLTRPMTVEYGDLDWKDRPTTILTICNGRHYGGGFMPVPEALPDDGVLDMLLIRDISLLTFVRVVGKYAKGRYKELPQYIQAFHGQSISFSSPREMITVVDGEVMKDTHFTVRLSEKKVNFFYPAGAVISRPQNLEKQESCV